MDKMKLRNKKGITLVALIITIIVLLILAGIAISQLTNSGLFEKTKLAKEKYKNAQILEETEMERADDEISKIEGERGNKSEQEILDLINKAEDDRHQSVTNSLFKVNYSSSSVLATGTRNIASFTSNITQDPEMNEYFTYDETNKKVICKKPGWYILNVSARCMRYDGDGSLTTYLKINDTVIDWADTWANGNNSEIQSMNVVTLYLKKDDIIDAFVSNGFRIIKLGANILAVATGSGPLETVKVTLLPFLTLLPTPGFI